MRPVLCAGVLVVAATNRPQAIDAALLRPGRFDALLFVPPPDLQGRLETLRIHTRSIPLDGDVDLQVRLVSLSVDGDELEVAPVSVGNLCIVWRLVHLSKPALLSSGQPPAQEQCIMQPG